MNVASAAMVLGLLIPSAGEGPAAPPQAGAQADDGSVSLAAMVVSIIDYCAPQVRMQGDARG